MDMPRATTTFVLLWLAALSAGSTPGADWPQFRGPNRDGISTETGLMRAWPADGPEVVWSTGLGQGYSAAAIHSGKVFFNDYDEATSEFLVRCLTLAEGKELWRFETGVPASYSEAGSPVPLTVAPTAEETAAMAG